MSASSEHAVRPGDAAGRADATSRRHLEIARVNALLVERELRAPEGAHDPGASRHHVHRQPKREMKEPFGERWCGKERELRVRDRLRQPDVDVQAQRGSDLVLEVLSDGSTPWLDAAKQFAFVEA